MFIGSASYGTTFEKDEINPGDQLGFSVGALLAASPETSLRVILNQTFVNELEVGDRAISGSDQVIGTAELWGLIDHRRREVSRPYGWDGFDR